MSNDIYNERYGNLINNIIDSQINKKSGISFGCALPHRKSIKTLTTNILEIIFPGYFTNCNNKDIQEHIECVINSTFEKLKVQIKIAIDDNNYNKEEIDAKANELTFAFYEKIPKIIEYAMTDVEAAFDGDPAANDRNIIIATYPGIFATTIQRIAHELYLLDIPYIPRIMTEYAHSKTGIDIHPGATIGKYFFIDHGTGVVIGETTVIGERVKVYQGVTLGAISTKDGQGLKGTKRHPTIMNDVTIYSDASVLGGDTIIHDNVVIAGNAFVTKSVYKKKKGESIDDYFDYII